MLKKLIILGILLLALAACGSPQEKAPDNPTAAPAATEAPVVEEVAPTNTPEPAATEAPVVEEPTPEPTATEAPAMPSSGLDAGEYIYSDGNQVRDVARNGNNIWAATLGGAVVYDITTGEGHKYTTLDGLPSNGIFGVEVCPINGEDRTIFTTENGLVVYDPTTDGWQMGTEFGWPDIDPGYTMTCDAANGFLFVEDDDVTIINLADSQTVSLDEDNNGIAAPFLDHIIPSGDDLWLAHGYWGLTRINPDGTVVTYLEESTDIPDYQIGDVAVASDGTVWMGGDENLLQLVNGTFTAFNSENTSVITYSSIDLVEIDSADNVWIEYLNDLCQFDPASGSCAQLITTEDMGLHGNASIGEFYIDADDTMLVSTHNHGVAYFDGSNWSAFTLENQSPTNTFSNLVETSDGTIWVFDFGNIY
ncbi:MAG: hypothetical protein KAG66_17135, partial [Methylococcales bacterium]|nr:hypothetical protein [Methylococcales bacterium]